MQSDRPQYLSELWFRGYRQAVEDFSIWKDGVRRIGCLDTSIKFVLLRALDELMVDATPEFKATFLTHYREINAMRSE